MKHFVVDSFIIRVTSVELFHLQSTFLKWRWHLLVRLMFISYLLKLGRRRICWQWGWPAVHCHTKVVWKFIIMEAGELFVMTLLTTLMPLSLATVLVLGEVCVFLNTTPSCVSAVLCFYWWHYDLTSVFVNIRWTDSSYLSHSYRRYSMGQIK